MTDKMLATARPLFFDNGERISDAEGIKLLRAIVKLSVGDLAAKLGVSPRTVEGWEQGRAIAPAVAYQLRDLLRDRRGTIYLAIRKSRVKLALY